MRKIRFVIIDKHKPDTFNWKRFLSGCFFALSIVLISMTFVNVISTPPPPPGLVVENPSESTGPTPINPNAFTTSTLSQTDQFPTHDSTFTATPGMRDPAPPSPTMPLISPTTPPVAILPSPGSDQSIPIADGQGNAQLEPSPSPTDSPTIAIPDSPTPTVTEQMNDPTNTAPPDAADPSPSPEPTTAEPESQPTSIIETSTPTELVERASATPTMTNTPQTPAGPPTPIPTSIPIPTDITVFGAEINRGYGDRMIGYAQDAAISWVRYNGIRWDEIEQSKGIRNWSSVADIESELRQLKQANIAPVVVIRGTPDWAQRVSSKSCGSPISEEELGTFASFLRDVVIRYSTSEYGVKYWELGNEPDVDPKLIQGQPMPYGCWGDLDDPFYGGRYYAEMLKEVYPAIKRADPQARVLLGGLLLDCDPSQGTDCVPGRFLEGILQNDGGSFFDIVSYHGYAYYGYWESESRDWDLDLPKWKHRGGAMLGKLDFIRQTLDSYQLKKPVMVTEIGLLCNDSVCLNYQFEQEQSNYAIRTYIRTLANGIIGASWYTLNNSGWQEAGLMDKSQSPREAYHTIKFLTNRLTGATFERKQISSDGNSERYVFRKGTISYEFHWTNQQQTSFDLPLPNGTQAVFRFGKTSTENGYESIEIQNQSSVGVEYYPIMIEIQ